MTTDLYSIPAANGISANALRTAADDATATLPPPPPQTSIENKINAHCTSNGIAQQSATTSSSSSSSSSSFPTQNTEEEFLFSPSLISSEILAILPEGYSARPLRRSDYHLGYLDVLRVLTTVGDISEDMWNERCDYLYKRNDEYYLIVITDGAGKIVGTGSLIVERKFIHTLGLVGHIEDIAVAQDQQGKKLGLRIIQTLDHVAAKVGCYKTILDCSEVNEGFYIKCGFKRAGLEMAHYY